MQYWEKIIGMAVTLVMGDGFWGVVLGLPVGHMFDRARSRKVTWFANQRERQALLSAAALEVMGHLTKSKGRITGTDIHIASQLMDQMNLHGASHTAAQNAFRVGKPDSCPLREKMRQFRSACFGRFDLIRVFLEIQVQAAFADGSLHPNERAVLYVIAEKLGVSHARFDQFLRMVQGGAQLGSDYQQQSGSGSQQQARRGPMLEDVYNMLGVKSTDGVTTIKRAYRKLMNEHRPGKLVAKGLPPEMMEMAKQRVQEIQQAYGLIKQQKGFK